MSRRLSFVSEIPPFQAAMTFRQFPRNSYSLVAGGHTFSKAEPGTEYQPGVEGMASGGLPLAWKTKSNAPVKNTNVAHTSNHLAWLTREKIFFVFIIFELSRALI